MGNATRLCCPLLAGLSTALLLSQTALARDKPRLALEDVFQLRYASSPLVSASGDFHWLQQGYTAQLTRLPSAPRQLAWSPDGEQLALRLRGVETAMVRMPGASHSITKRPRQMAGKVAAILAWFSQHSSKEEENHDPAH